MRAAGAGRGGRGARPHRPVVPGAPPAAARVRPGHVAARDAAAGAPASTRRCCSSRARPASASAPARCGACTSAGAATIEHVRRAAARRRVDVLGGGELLEPGEVVLAPGRGVRDAVAVRRLVGPRARRAERGVCTASSRARPEPPARAAAGHAQHLGGGLLRPRPRPADGRSPTRAAELGVERFVLDDGWFRAAATTPPGSATGTSTRTSGRTGCTRWSTTSAASAWSSGCGSSRRWSTRTPTSPARTRTGCSPPTAAARGATSRSSTSPSPTPSRTCWSGSTRCVTEYAIDYLKWDHNRDRRGGRGAACTRRPLAVYRLLDELRGRASRRSRSSRCSSGGARIDLGILARTDRVWASDTNDALERQPIQRWTGAAAAAGAGRRRTSDRRAAHTTGRTHDLSFRVATALFGHVGIEWDISAADRRRAAPGWRTAIALYKRVRPLLHGGEVVRADHPDPAVRAARRRGARPRRGAVLLRGAGDVAARWCPARCGCRGWTRTAATA